MKSFKEYIAEMPYRKIEKLHPVQKYIDTDVDKGWIDYLRRHLRSKKSEAVFKKRNPTFMLTTTTGRQKKETVKPDKKLWPAINVIKSGWQWHREKADKEDEMDITDGHHRYYARKLEGKKKIRTDK